MRAVVQRVKEASVSVDAEIVGSVKNGLLVYLGVCKSDTRTDLEYLAVKIAGLRIFADDAGNMNRSVIDVDGAALVISQFTLYGDVRRGKRPSFTDAMEPVTANELYEQFVSMLQDLGVPCTRGIFGAMMDVRSVNDGPVTILLDSSKLF
jgi:D-tyrosyl-tRNA(Tyr) deacylase